MKNTATVTNSDLNSVGDVFNWFTELVDMYGVSWHPESLFDEENIPDADILNQKMEQAYSICEEAGIDICGLAMDASEEYRHRFGLGVEEEYIQ